MQKLLLLFFSIQLLILSFTSCKKTDERITNDSSAVLAFDTDSVIFDTVFTGRLSITQRLKIYNRNNNAVKISSISIGQNFPSNFKIIVDGTEANIQKDILLRGKDSILILVKALIDPQDKSLPYIIDENIEFVTNGNTQSVKVVAWGQDAYFHYSDSITVNTTWPVDKPHIIYDYVKVNKNTTLTLLPATKVFMHGNALLYVQGNLKAKGSFDNKIEFDDDRLEQYKNDLPGYWYGILFDEGSKDNEIDWTVIQNSQWGVRLGTPDTDKIPDLIIKNTTIRNVSTVGILGYTSDILGINCVVTTCAQSSVAGLAGGNYTFINCTFANGSHLFTRKNPTAVFADYILDANNQPTLINDMELVLVNNIIWGTQDNEFTVSDIGSGGTITPIIANNLIKTTTEGLNINDNIINLLPFFLKIDGVAKSKDIDLRLREDSPCLDKGIVTIFYPENKDLDNKNRDAIKPDLGAYER